MLHDSRRWLLIALVSLAAPLTAHADPLLWYGARNVGYLDAVPYLERLVDCKHERVDHVTERLLDGQSDDQGEDSERCEQPKEFDADLVEG